MISYFHDFFNEWWFSRTILCIHKAVAYTTYFELGNWYFIKWRLDYTVRHGETSWVFLDLAHFWPEFYLQMGKKINISFNFMFFSWFELIRVDPSRSELIRPGLAIRVDPVRLLYLPLKNPFHLAISTIGGTEQLKLIAITGDSCRLKRDFSWDWVCASWNVCSLQMCYTDPEINTAEICIPLFHWQRMWFLDHT